MEAVRKAVLACMRNCTPDDDLISSLNSVVEQDGEGACKIIMEMVAHRDCDHQDAARHWEKIVAHQAELSRIIGRSVGLHATVCDYFHWVEKSIGYRKLIDVHTFEEIFNQARRDFLTGLYNRQEFEEMLKREIARAKRYDRKVSLLFFDVDSFKKLNDQYGHLAGDKALQYLAKILGEKKRLEDMVARYGGDEFVVLLPDTQKKDALGLAERLRERINSRKITMNGYQLPLTISGGVATFPDDAQDAVKLIDCADHALQVAKRGGKNSMLSYEKEVRKFVRLPFTRKIKAKATSGNKEVPLSTESKNFSGGGMLLENKFSVDLGSVIEIRIVLDGKAIAIMGEVVRTDQLATNRFDIGVAFLENQESVQLVLDNYVLDSIRQGPVSCQ